jgi:preprotein translocase subunit SecF
MNIVTHRKVFYGFTGIALLFSLFSLWHYGLELSTEFTGGTAVQVQYANRPSIEEVQRVLGSMGLADAAVRPAGDTAYDIRTANLSDEVRGSLAEALSLNGEYPAQITKFSEVGPSIGAELRSKALMALVLVLLGIMFFVAFAFRGVSRPVSSWAYGTIALIALVHDVIIPFGVYALMGEWWGAQVDTLFVTAILTILGFSVHDTIVVFDRVRENLKLNSHAHASFEEVVGKSLNQTLVRSVNTSFTTALALFALYWFGPESTENFSLILLVGIIAGTYSSICIATPLLVTWEKWRRARA